MKLTFPKYETESEPERKFVGFQIIWYTLIPLLFLYVGLKYHPLFLFLILPSVFLRIQQ